MKQDSGLQSAHRGSIITLKQFEESYALTKNTAPNVITFVITYHSQKSVITEHWIKNINFLLNKMEKYEPAYKNCCDKYFKLRL